MRKWWLALVPLACASTDAPPRTGSTPTATVNASAPNGHEAPRNRKATRAERCDAKAIDTIRAVLDRLSEHGVRADHVADCQPEQATCPAEYGPLAAGDACQIIAHRRDGWWDVDIVPRPTMGAPTRIEATTRVAGTVDRVNVGGSTWAVIDGVRIEGRGEHAWHTHGGDAARIGSAELEVTNDRNDPVTLRLVYARWLTAFSCELPREERSRPKVAGMAVGSELVEGAMTAEIPARATRTVTVGHEAQEAYSASCERFATAVTLDMDGERVEVIAEHEVMREEELD